MSNAFDSKLATTDMNTHLRATRSSSEDEAQRFVADDSPPHGGSRAKQAVIPPQQGLIVVQPLKKSEMQPSYAQDLGAENISHGVYGSFTHGLGICMGLLGAIPCCPLPNPYKSVPQGQVGLVSRFGSFFKAVDPGLVNVNVCTESIKTVDVRIRMDGIPRQTVMTKDNVSVGLDSVICWHIISPYQATYGIADVRETLIERAQTTLRHVIGARTLQSVVTEREAIANEIAEIVEAPARNWGVTVESILIKDIVFSQELQQSLSSAAQAKRVGESKVIAARAEVDSARLMREAADILASPAAMSIRTLEALQNMAKTSNSKVIFVPMNLPNMGSSAPGSAAGNENLNTQSGPSFQAIAEHADEGHEFIGARSSVGQAGLLNTTSQI
ncbi:stomatin family protein [Phaffia rhodozyma]|uniref:Stomatin family protein n=1 Tax=Phaffia rhodozyma TaxID=264483 RepID=A0A0F7SGR3_PHARH|nr:stomatin family protein [Phaffia rhodozyma]